MSGLNISSQSPVNPSSPDETPPRAVLSSTSALPLIPGPSPSKAHKVASATSPPPSSCSHEDLGGPSTFDLCGNPNDFDNHVKVYVSLVGCAVHPLPSAPGNDGHQLLAPPVDASALVTPENLARGLERLRYERATNPAGQGRVFSSFLPLKTGRTRTAYRFLPQDLDEDEVQRMVSPDSDDPLAYIDMFGNSLVLTDYVLPIPKALVGVRPLSLHHTVIAWLYGHHHPALLASNQLRVTYESDDDDSDGELKPVPIVDMDAHYPDELIQTQIASQILHNVAGLRRLRQMTIGSFTLAAPDATCRLQRSFDKLESKFPWVSPAFAVEFPRLGQGDEWLDRLPERVYPP
ncbi:hypothetical protein CC85DRAFT_327147 [Cutaneotrichosporon oleaginosum]|uniref:Uncharacterized protein n=1 Tax=Cutaneotrichosporon oleaginosum TaxID=879819 RepID=A0A0J0XR47_9TREE|nr:uncharacterized protein CC85DRAFT_327147 [Cutaneotrichosporon oleaginosum]KLT43596.1 hypothetical protein CC85DRAFT_327147 [Cutaneotrichosporon oleaginosum]TXT12736.1 hypothetical protein COLE_03146 [Cutaneotrichosporon oleaginosum]